MTVAEGSDSAASDTQPDYADFDLDDPKLPEMIDARALASGNYPHKKRMKRKRFEEELVRLQIELVKLQYWVRDRGERVVMLFEGRDAAGKGGTIKRFMQHLNPRHARTIALSKPTEAERGQWYYQRYAAHLPTAGDIVLFDRSWYNRAGVERVMGFCNEPQVEAFLNEAPQFEAALARDGIRLFKFWLTIGREMQIK
ncbi:MAG: polyphosphate kinase 2, partial [Methyloligellaceae bacterium]